MNILNALLALSLVSGSGERDQRLAKADRRFKPE